VTDDRSGVTAPQRRWTPAFAAVAFDATGNLTFTTALSLDGSADGGHAVRLRATDGSGNVSPLVNFAFTLDTPEPPPPGPPLIPSLAESTSFLYTGSNPIQTGVAAGTIDPLRVAVLRGLVRTGGGSALDGVTVTVLGHLSSARP
jgi:hypothetical protein